MAELTTPPWNLPIVSIDVTRITVVANSDVSWSATRAQQYMALYGIPSGNLIGLPFGTGTVYTQSTPTFSSQVYTPLRAKLAALGGPLIIGPSIPSQWAVPLLTGSSGSWAAGPGSSDVGLWLIMAMAKKFTSLTQVVGATGTGLGGNAFTPYDLLSPSSIVALNPGSVSQFLGGDYTENFTLKDSSGVYQCTVPDQGGLSAALSSERLYVPFGKVGWGGWDLPLVPAETNANIGQLLAQIESNLALSQLYAQTAPLLHSILAIGTSPITEDCAWVQQLKAWGANVKYYYHSADTPPAPFNVTVPISGAVSPWATLSTTGISPPATYTVFMGNVANGEIPNAPWTTNQNPVNGGVALIGGASGGYQNNQWEVSTKQASGTTDGKHREITNANEAVSIWYGVLRGLPLMLARHFLNFSGNGTANAMGDPLWSPFRAAAANTTGQGYKRGYRWIA